MKIQAFIVTSEEQEICVSTVEVYARDCARRFNGSIHGAEIAEMPDGWCPLGNDAEDGAAIDERVVFSTPEICLKNGYKPVKIKGRRADGRTVQASHPLGGAVEVY